MPDGTTAFSVTTQGPADTGTNSPQVDASGQQQQAQQQAAAPAPAADAVDWKAKFEEAQAGRDRAKARYKEIADAQDQAAQDHANKLKEQGKLLELNQQYESQIEQLKQSAGRVEALEAAFGSQVKALRESLPEAYKGIVPEGLDPLKEIEALNKLQAAIGQQQQQGAQGAPSQNSQTPKTPPLPPAPPGVSNPYGADPETVPEANRSAYIRSLSPEAKAYWAQVYKGRLGK